MIFSVIVPAYNCEKTIISCLNSIRKSLVGFLFEIIVVENGSTDNTFFLIDEYASEVDNVVVVRSEKGASRARNAGLSVAKGENIIFVDSDDLILPNCFEFLKKDLAFNADLYVYNYNKVNVRNGKVKSVINYIDNEFDYEKKVDILFSNPTKGTQVWGKIFKRDVIFKNGICFDEDLSYAEDSEFLLKYISCISNIYFSKNFLYNYMIYDNSSVRTIVDKSFEYEKSLEKIKSSNVANLSSCTLNKFILCNLNVVLVHYVFNKKINNSFFSKMKKMHLIIKKDIYSIALKEIRYKDCLTKRFLPEFFIKIHLSIISGFLCYLKSLI